MHGKILIAIIFVSILCSGKAVNAANKVPQWGEVREEKKDADPCQANFEKAMKRAKAAVQNLDLGPEEAREMMGITEKFMESFKPLESWECFDHTFEYHMYERGRGPKPSVLARLCRFKVKGNQGFEYGQVEVAGNSQETGFLVDGFDRVWTFSDKYNNNYAFTIKPNGIGLYYRFGKKKTVKPSQLFKCKNRRP